MPKERNKADGYRGKAMNKDEKRELRRKRLMDNKVCF